MSQPDQRGPQRGSSAGPLDQSAKTPKQSSAQGESRNLSVPAVEFRDVSFSFDDEKVLDRLSFKVMKGEIKIILSGSGGGKSTIRLRDLENVTSILVTHEMDTVKYITSEYAVVSEKGEVTVEEEGDNFCLSNTKILMLREGARDL